VNLYCVSIRASSLTFVRNRPLCKKHIEEHSESACVHQCQVHFLVASTKSDPVCESRFPNWSESECPPDCCKNGLDSFPCPHQSFRWLSWEEADDCIFVKKMLINLLNCPLLQWRGKWISDAKCVSGTGPPPRVNVNWFLALVGPIITPNRAGLWHRHCRQMMEPTTSKSLRKMAG